MATMAVERVFVDSNVIVYASVPAAPFHSEAVQSMQALRAAGAELWISRQTVREFLATITRPQFFLQALSSRDAAIEAAKLLPLFEIAEDGPGVTANLFALCTNIPSAASKSMTVATMQAYGIGKLLTHNTVDFARYQHLITVIPLV